MEIINDAFMTVADTVAYYELSLRPPPPADYLEKNGKIKYNNLLHQSVAIIVPDTLYSFVNDTWGSTISLHCKGWNSNEDSSIIELRKQMCKIIEENTEPQKFDLNSLADIGRYTLIKNKTALQSNIPLVGTIRFSQVVINNEGNLALFLAIISDNGMAFIEKLFILKKDKLKWTIIKTEILTVS